MNISIFVVFFLFSFFSLVFFLVSGGVYFFNFMEWCFLSLKMKFYFSSIMFALILFLVTASVLVFSSYYMEGELNLMYFLMILMIFVGSMFFLILSGGSFSMLLSWDILGISSFFLVLFYNNWDSCSGAMNTVLTNRVGDYFMFLFFGVIFFNIINFEVLGFLGKTVVIFVFLAGFTKSAQFPFMGWLPKAMSAPTPVSSLVHSSTLVTAGLILVMNFNLLLLSKDSSLVVLSIGILTMFFSSVAAMVEEDVKKIVALSTLSQMGFAMLTVGLGLNFISLVHLLSHALFKSCLFMQVGFLIHCSYSQQDGRYYSNLVSVPFYIQLQMLITLFCLCGLFFSSGSVSKDYILELFFSNNFNIVLFFMFFFSVFLTFGYSYRLWKSLFLVFVKSVNYVLGSFLTTVFSFVLVMFSVCLVWWMSMNLFLVPSFYLYVDFFSPLIYVIMLIVMMFLVVRFILVEFKYKFVGDFGPKLSSLVVKNSKFIDNFLISSNNILFSLTGIFSGLGNIWMKSLNFNVVVVIIFVLFFLV